MSSILVVVPHSDVLKSFLASLKQYDREVNKVVDSVEM